MPKISERQKKIRMQRILDSAYEVFGQKGYSETSIDDIVKHSGVSKGGIYTYFPTKESILLEIAERRFVERNLLVEELRQCASAREKIIKYILWVLGPIGEETYDNNTRFTFEFWTVLTRSEDKKSLSLERYEKFEKHLMELIQSGIDSGEFRKNLNIKHAALHLISGLDGMSFMGTVMGVEVERLAIEEFAHLYLNYWEERA